MDRYYLFLSGIVPSEAVPPRDYFLKALQEPLYIWLIRIALIVTAVIVAVIFFRMRKDR